MLSLHSSDAIWLTTSSSISDVNRFGIVLSDNFSPTGETIDNETNPNYL